MNYIKMMKLRFLPDVYERELHSAGMKMPQPC